MSNVDKTKKTRISIKARRIWSLLKKVFLLIPAAPFVLVIRILKPFIVIRFMTVDIGRIGGLLFFQWYLSERRAGKHKGFLDICFFIKTTGIVSNRQWYKMWKRAENMPSLFLSEFFFFVYKLNKHFPGFEDHMIPTHDVLPVYNKEFTGQETLKCVLDDKESCLRFNSKEEKLGQEMLNALGIPEGKPFICFHCRDAAYLDAVEPEANWRYHDYRDSHIENYVPAVEKMVQRHGYYAIRMGAVVKEELKTDNPSIIDYAANGARKDFLDIYLGAKCRFFICSDTGMSMISEVFRVPVVYVNWPSLARVPVFILNGLLIPKKVYSKKENRFLTFPEIIHSEVGTCSFGERFEELEIELMENTPEEIMAATLEMEGRLNGTWKTTKEDEELQERFWEIFGPNKLKSPNFRIGMDYLRQNQDLLNSEEVIGLRK